VEEHAAFTLDGILLIRSSGRDCCSKQSTNCASWYLQVVPQPSGRRHSVESPINRVVRIDIHPLGPGGVPRIPS
jgi:hypothetical protein